MRTFLATRHGRRVGGVGPRGAQVVLLGEALGKDEEKDGEPFVGAAGRFLFEGRDWSGPTGWPGLNGIGLPRRDIRIENVIETKPLDNLLLHMTPATVRKWQADCWERLGRLSPNEIVPVGNLALNTLRRAPLPLRKDGKWRVRSSPQGPQIDWRDKITNWRGSIFNCTFPNGERCKVIPTFHPAYVMRSGDSWDVWKSDWARIVADAQFPALRRDPDCEHLIFPSKSQCWDFVHLVESRWKKDRASVLAGDIETIKRRWVDCIGFSLDPEFSITLDLKQGWPWVIAKRLLSHPIAKGWHYGLTDTFVLRRQGCAVRNNRWDSHQMHHCLDPRDQHSLAYCASRDLRVRFWKDEGKEDGKEKTIKHKPKRHRYCGKDVSYTRALITRGRPKLAAAGLLGVYHEHYRRLSAACLRLSTTGFLVDDTARREIATREKEVLKAIRAEITQATGQDLIASKGFSNPKVTAYFYDRLKCKPFRKRGTGTRTADELSIRKLMRRYKKARPVGQLILDYRQHQKIREGTDGHLVDSDSRMRSLYTPTAKTGRLRAHKTPEGRGVNAQARDRHSDLRRMFIADPGHVLVEIDQSQAEDRIAGGMSGEHSLLDQARASPLTFDRHKATAALLFDCEEAQVTFEQRDLGKRTRYATWYGMQGQMMADTALKESEGRLVLDPDQCDEWIALLKKKEPGIPRYQEWVSEQVLTKGYLEDEYGWRIYWKGLRLTKEDHKEAFAWHPQKSVGKLTNQLGFIPTDLAIRKGWWPGAKIVQQGHDSLIVTTPPQYAWKVALFVTTKMGEDRIYPGAGGPWNLRMPCGVKIGKRWKDMVEWKVLPGQEEFMAGLAQVGHV